MLATPALSGPQATTPPAPERPSREPHVHHGRQQLARQPHAARPTVKAVGRVVTPPAAPRLARRRRATRPTFTESAGGRLRLLLWPWLAPGAVESGAARPDNGTYVPFALTSARRLHMTGHRLSPVLPRQEHGRSVAPASGAPGRRSRPARLRKKPSAGPRHQARRLRKSRYPLHRATASASGSGFGSDHRRHGPAWWPRPRPARGLGVVVHVLAALAVRQVRALTRAHRRAALHSHGRPGLRPSRRHRASPGEGAAGAAGGGCRFGEGRSRAAQRSRVVEEGNDQCIHHPTARPHDWGRAVRVRGCGPQPAVRERSDCAPRDSGGFLAGAAGAWRAVRASDSTTTAAARSSACRGHRAVRWAGGAQPAPPPEPQPCGASDQVAFCMSRARQRLRRQEAARRAWRA